MNIYMEKNRKKTKIKDRSYVFGMMKSVAQKLMSRCGGDDEIILTEIANCKDMLENILDEMTYED